MRNKVCGKRSGWRQEGGSDSRENRSYIPGDVWGLAEAGRTKAIIWILPSDLV